MISTLFTSFTKRSQSKPTQSVAHRNWLTWLDENLLTILAGFLLVFIPLYPKIPLFSPIEQYIVRVRLEDIFVLLTFLIWGVYWLRGKVAWRKPIVYALLAYIGVGFLSVLSAVFVIKTVPLEPLHLGKTLLHYFRHIQYFSLFFIAFSAIKTKRHIKVLIASIIFTVLAVSIYGFGQRHFYWPVYSTMNREFSKGVRLYLTEHARVQSTFAGHYDLGAYLVIVLPILLALGYGAKKTWQKVVIHGVHWVGIWLLVVSASRSSFAAYILGITLVTLLFAVKQTGWLKKIWWWTSRYFVLGTVITLTFFTYGQDIYERLMQVLKSYPVWHQRYHDANGIRIALTDKYVLVPLGLKEVSIPKAQVPKNAISTDQAQDILVKSDTQPTTSRPLPSDVYEDIPDLVRVSTTSADGATTVTYEERDRTYSENALRYGLSLAIRLDTLWPQAIEGFKRNPLVGSGYATLNKENPYDFTEADSTDNNFLRTLGETGALGFITFYGAIGLALYYAFQAARSKDEVLQALAIGYIGGTLGLLGNAIYIDVFVASKVAQVFWALTGFLLAYYYLVQDKTSLKTAQVSTAPTAQSSIADQTGDQPITKIKKKGKHKKARRVAKNLSQKASK